jgi:hypothetical protein
MGLMQAAADDGTALAGVGSAANVRANQGL